MKIIAGSVGLWSLFTAACGLSHNFWQLFLARMGVGIGEAGGVAPSYALISDFYPRGEAGAGARLLLARHSDRLGAWRLLRRLDRKPSHWRSAFLIVGLAGLPAALLVWLFIPEVLRL